MYASKKHRVLSFFALLIFLIGCFWCFSACTSSRDKKIAQEMVEKIENIDEITLDSAENIYALKTEYDLMSDTQKYLVTNSADLLRAVDKVETLLILDEISNDPKRNIDKHNLYGLWQSRYDTSSSHYWNIAFTENSIYYMGSKTTNIGNEIFSNEFLIAINYSFDSVDKSTRLKQGEFYNPDLGRAYKFTVKRENDQYIMRITGSPINNTFFKNVDNSI